MTSVFEITGWNQVASFFVWTLAVCALAKAIFGSFVAAELQYRLALRDNPRRQRITRLNWEVGNRTRWNEDVARGSPHAAPVRLTDAEVEAKRRQLLGLARKSLAGRAFTYFMGCFACQTFWAAVAIFALTRGVRDVGGWVISAAAYSGAAVLLSLFHAGNASVRAGEPAANRAGCKVCGK
jgi:hypothetical protein